jgi:hypothetical protein
MSERRENLQDDGRPRGDEDFWTIGTTAMIEDEARMAAAWVSDTFPCVHAFVLDPRRTLTVGMDRDTVEMMRSALALYASEGGEVGTMLEQLEEWLSATAHD